MTGNLPIIHAITIKPVIKVLCPYCSTNKKPKYHIHGNENNLKNRIITRLSHCKKIDTKQYHILIDSNTLR